MTRQDRFEKVYAQLHEMDSDLIHQHRFIYVDGYSLPRLAAAYRVYCATMDSVVIELPRSEEYDSSADVSQALSDVAQTIESAGVKWK